MVAIPTLLWRAGLEVLTDRLRTLHISSSHGEPLRNSRALPRLWKAASVRKAVVAGRVRCGTLHCHPRRRGESWPAAITTSSGSPPATPGARAQVAEKNSAHPRPRGVLPARAGVSRSAGVSFDIEVSRRRRSDLGRLTSLSRRLPCGHPPQGGEESSASPGTMDQPVATSIPPLWQTYSAPGNSCSHAARVWAVRSGRTSIRSLAGVDAEELRHPGGLPAGGAVARRSSSGDRV